MDGALQSARELGEKRLASGFDQAALDTAAREGFGNSLFEEQGEDVSEMLEEFYPQQETSETITEHDSLRRRLKSRQKTTVTA